MLIMAARTGTEEYSSRNLLNFSVAIHTLEEFSQISYVLIRRKQTLLWGLKGLLRQQFPILSELN